MMVNDFFYSFIERFLSQLSRPLDISKHLTSSPWKCLRKLTLKFGLHTTTVEIKKNKNVEIV